jgi:signal peptidase I
VAVPKERVVSFVVELVVVLAVAALFAVLIQAFLIKPYRIPSGSMLPTLHINQRVLVDRIGNDFSSPTLGNIYVFHPPSNYAEGCANPTEGQAQSGADLARPCGVAQRRASSQTFIKRVVGLPGDRISIRHGDVYRDGVRERAPYIAPCGRSGECNFPGTITVPAGEYYMMGDNRGQSDDSRFWGPVPRAWLIGRAFLTYWPPDRIGTL